MSYFDIAAYKRIIEKATNKDEADKFMKMVEEVEDSSINGGRYPLTITNLYQLSIGRLPANETARNACRYCKDYFDRLLRATSFNNIQEIIDSLFSAINSDASVNDNQRFIQQTIREVNDEIKQSSINSLDKTLVVMTRAFFLAESKVAYSFHLFCSQIRFLDSYSSFSNVSWVTEILTGAGLRTKMNELDDKKDRAKVFRVLNGEHPFSYLLETPTFTIDEEQFSQYFNKEILSYDAEYPTDPKKCIKCVEVLANGILKDNRIDFVDKQGIIDLYWRIIKTANVSVGTTSSQELIELISDFVAKALQLAIEFDNKPKSQPSICLTNFDDICLDKDNTMLLCQELTIRNRTLGSNHKIDPIAFLGQLPNQRLIIAAEGGMGKSTFLDIIGQTAVCSDHYSAVVKISLPSLIPSDKDYCVDSTEQNYFYLEKRLRASFSETDTQEIIDISIGKKKNNPVIFLLDGHNELVSSSDGRVEKIRNEIEIISDKFTNAFIIITTRPVGKSANIPFFDFSKPYRELTKYDCTATITGVTDSDIQKLPNYEQFNDEINRLARIPLYYNMLKDLDTVPETRYDLFQKALETDCEQQTDANKKHVFDATLIDASYMFIAPYLAREACKKPGYVLSKETIRKQINQLIKDKKDLWDSFYFRLREKELDKEYTADKYFAVLTKNELLTAIETRASNGELLIDGNLYRFKHQDWAEFFCAYSFIFEIGWLCDNYTSSLSRFSEIELNYPSTVNTFLREGLRRLENLRRLSIETDQDTNGQTEEAIANRIRAIFGNLAFVGTEDSLYGEIKLADVVTQCAEGVGYPRDSDPIREAVHERISPIVNKYMQRYENDQQYFPEDAPFPQLLNIIVKECEYFRRNYDFANDIRRFEFGQKILQSIQDYQLKQQREDLDNQHAKALLYNHRGLVTKKNQRSPFPGVKQEPDVLWKKGFEELQKNANNGSTMSSNLLGCIYATPAPYLIEGKAVDKIDPVNAYNVYKKLIDSAGSKKSGNKIAYTVRSIVGLLVKGYVSINSDGCAGKGNLDPESINENTKKEISSLLKLAWGSDLSFMPYLRGFEQLYCNNNGTEAHRFFLQDEGIIKNNAIIQQGNIMNNIMLKYRFKEDKDEVITKGYSSLKELILNHGNQFGEIDKIHAIYLYVDAKQVELALAKGEIRREREAFFHEYEEELGEKWQNIVKLFEQSLS